MRVNLINGTTVTYPDSTVWIGDNMPVSLSNPTYTVGADIVVTNMASLKSKQLIHVSELKNLMFSLNDAVRSLFSYGGCDMNVKVSVYTDGFFDDSFGFNIKVLEGKTLPNRSHGSTQTVYAYSIDDLYKMSFIFAGTGQLSANGHSFPVVSPGYNSFDFRSYITHSGTYQLCYRYGAKGGGQDTTTRIEITDVNNITPFSAVTNLSFSDIDDQPSQDEIKGGGIWNDEQINLVDYCIDLVWEDSCDDFNFFKVRYFDTDGCLRYLGGKIESETTNSKQDNYYRSDNYVYRNISRKHFKDMSGTVKVVYPDLKRNSYWSDILLADRIDFLSYDGNWIECSLVTSKATVKSEDSEDVSLEFELYKL